MARRDRERGVSIFGVPRRSRWCVARPFVGGAGTVGGVGLVTLSAEQWRAQEAAHQERVTALTAAHLERRRLGERHPIEDFLFDYYGYAPARLQRWHPGPGITLEHAANEPRATWAHTRVDEHGAVTLDAASFTAARSKALAFIRAIVTATLSRDAQTNCFGLHEWAMVYRAPAERRHPTLPLRLGPTGTNAVVDAHTIRCTHFDATRFFTPQGLARNTLTPTRDTMVDDEQPGCLHAGMDVYRWATKLDPAIPSTLTADAFTLARDIRIVDMRASPYDLTSLGHTPITIETPDGKRAYADHQRHFAQRANTLRRRLLRTLDDLAAAANQPAN
jgi:hypothetical protein